MKRALYQLTRVSALASAVVLVAACADGPTTPGVAGSALPSTIVLSRQDSGSGNFTIDPNDRLTVIIGDHRLTIPKGAVCDPSTTVYAKDQWDAPCTPASAPIAMHVDWSVVNGKSEIQFSPDLRFVPTESSKPNDWVVLELRHPSALDAQTSYQILWKDVTTGEWVDEAQGDASLRAWTDRNENRIKRRLKHFSGYQGSIGITEQDGVSIDGGVTIWAY